MTPCGQIVAGNAFSHDEALQQSVRFSLCGALRNAAHLICPTFRDLELAVHESMIGDLRRVVVSGHPGHFERADRALRRFNDAPKRTAQEVNYLIYSACTLQTIQEVAAARSRR